MSKARVMRFTFELPLDPAAPQAEIALGAELKVAAEQLRLGELPAREVRETAAIALLSLHEAILAAWMRKPSNSIAAELAHHKRLTGTSKDTVAVREAIEALGLSITPWLVTAVQRTLDRRRQRARSARR